MIIIGLIIVAILILGIVLEARNSLNATGFGLIGLSSILLFCYAIVWPASYYSYKSNIYEYNAIKETISQSRKENISEIERAALTTKIIEVNQSLASAKYWNNTIFDEMIPDEFANLEPLK